MRFYLCRGFFKVNNIINLLDYIHQASFHEFFLDTNDVDSCYWHQDMSSVAYYKIILICISSFCTLLFFSSQIHRHRLWRSIKKQRVIVYGDQPRNRDLETSNATNMFNNHLGI
ncbi:hypothetical protein Dimus_037310 [Dionaea muscipula]